MDRQKIERSIKGLSEWQMHVQAESDIDTNISTAIEALKAQLSQEGTTSDAINRQDAIDIFDDYNVSVENGDLEAYRRDRKRLCELPPAQPEPPWILCSDKMPEEHEWIGTKKFGTTISDEVYVTFENEKGERFCRHMKFQNGELSRHDKAYMDALYKGSKPIAWMPLPEPARLENV